MEIALAAGSARRPTRPRATSRTETSSRRKGSPSPETPRPPSPPPRARRPRLPRVGHLRGLFTPWDRAESQDCLRGVRTRRAEGAAREECSGRPGLTVAQLRRARGRVEREEAPALGLGEATLPVHERRAA